MNNLIKSNSISVFNFKSTPVRTQLVDDNIWFCLIDVCDSLNLKRNSSVISRLEEKGCRKTATLTEGGIQELNYINEPNLYRLIFRSNKPAAVQFGNWVYEEVLPTIRKTGSYGSPAIDMKAIGGMVKKCCAVAVRDEIQTAIRQEVRNTAINIILAAEKFKPLQEVTDDMMLRCLYNWYGTRHHRLLGTINELSSENAKLKSKISTVKKTVN